MKSLLIVTIVFLCFTMATSLIVFVKDIDNKVSIVQIKDLRPDSTIAELKYKIALMKKLPIWAFHVLFKDLLLKDMQTLASCGVPEGGTINIIVKNSFAGLFFLAGKL